MADSPSDGAPAKAPRWDLADTEGYAGGNCFSLAPWMFSGYVGIYRRKKYVGGRPRGPQDRGRTLQGGSLLSRGSLVSLSDYFFLPKILKYSKTDKNYLWSCFGVGLLTVPHTYSFSKSGTFWKVSLMYSSRVTVSIILVSTLIGLPEM